MNYINSQDDEPLHIDALVIKRLERIEELKERLKDNLLTPKDEIELLRSLSQEMTALRGIQYSCFS